MCVCVCERDREREGGGVCERERERCGTNLQSYITYGLIHPLIIRSANFLVSDLASSDMSVVVPR